MTMAAYDYPHGAVSLFRQAEENASTAPTIATHDSDAEEQYTFNSDMQHLVSSLYHLF